MSQNETFAQDLAENLKRSGMNATVLPPSPPDEGYRVVLGPFPTRDAAEDAGRKLGKPFWVFSKDQAPATP
jgi:cell division septation protein DedD